jgi:tetratricopeptide (TPR) repeat protein
MQGMLLSAIALGCLVCHAQTVSQRPPTSNSEYLRDSSFPNQSTLPLQAETSHAREELRQGTALTRQGQFADAIPHLLAAQRIVGNDFALEFNLSLCYIGVGEYNKAISVLDGLRHQTQDANVENLLAQAYIGLGQHKEALAALERAAVISPTNEKLFTYAADACMDHQDFEFGLKLVELGLTSLPDSTRLHYERATFLSELDQLDRAKAEFELATRLGRGSEIGYLAGSQQNMLEGNIDGAIRIAREGVRKGIHNPALFTVLGKALLRSGVTPDQPEFNEAQSVLEKSVSLQPNDASTQIALGQAYLLGNHVDAAIAHLETARGMRPNQPSVYASLAKAYQRLGDSRRAQEALQMLQSLNLAQAERIRSAPGERKMSYGGSPSSKQ